MTVTDAALDKMVEALKISAVTFRAYERTHRVKGTPDADRKAFGNACLAHICEAALRAAGVEVLS